MNFDHCEFEVLQSEIIRKKIWNTRPLPSWTRYTSVSVYKYILNVFILNRRKVISPEGFNTSEVQGTLGLDRDMNDGKIHEILKERYQRSTLRVLLGYSIFDNISEDSTPLTRRGGTNGVLPHYPFLKVRP